MNRFATGGPPGSPEGDVDVIPRSREQRRRVALASLIAIVAGILCGFSLGTSLDSIDDAGGDVDAARSALLADPDLDALHHAIHAEVGETAWEAAVKPEFLRALTTRVVGETGDPLPSWQAIVGWAREHPAETRAMLEAAAK